MFILTIRTDKPESEIGLYEDDRQLEYEVWSAHRQLAETIHTKIGKLLNGQSRDFNDIAAIVCYKGPGSFTGLRIGLSVANALAYGLDIPVVGIEGEEDWINRGIGRLLEGQNDRIAMPEYGTPVHITQPKH